MECICTKKEKKTFNASVNAQSGPHSWSHISEALTLLWLQNLQKEKKNGSVCECTVICMSRYNSGASWKRVWLKWEELAWVRHSSTWEEPGKFKCQEAKCREKPWKVRARTYRTKSHSRSEALRFMDSAKSPSTKIDDSLVNFRRRLSNRHGRPRRMLTMDIRRTPIGLWAHLRDSHKSGPQSGWSLAWTLAQRTDWSGKSWPGYDIVVHEKS